MGASAAGIGLRVVAAGGAERERGRERERERPSEVLEVTGRDLGRDSPKIHLP